MSKTEKQEEKASPVFVSLVLTEDGDVELSTSNGMDLATLAFIIGLAQHKANMSYYGMVLRNVEQRRQDEDRKKPKLLVPR